MDGDFESGIAKARKAIEGLQGKDVTIKGVGIDETLSSIQSLNAAVTALKNNAVDIVIGDKVGGANGIKPTLDPQAGAKLKADIEAAIANVTLNSVNAQNLVASINTAMGGGLPLKKTNIFLKEIKLKKLSSE